MAGGHTISQVIGYLSEVYHYPICDQFWENVPKVGKTTIEIRLKVGNNSIFNKYLKPMLS